MPRVSIIMGIYNCGSILSRSIDSIINQTYTDWELIMCDDCSTDNTLEVAKEYENKYKNIKVIKNKKNMRLAYTLNQCLKISTGEYIARMDADDICLPERLETQVKFLDNNPMYHVVGSSVVLFDENGDQAIRTMKEIPTKYDLTKTAPHIHPTIMIRKVIYDNLGGYTVSERTKRCEDTDLWFRFYSKGYRGYNIKAPLLKYHESISDYKKRDINVAFMGVVTRYLGYKQLKLPLKYYITILKPIISAIIPNKLMYVYHKRIKG